MNSYIFYRESDDFSDILEDNNLKKLTKFKLLWLNHLMIGSNETDDEIKSYILLKYGEDLVRNNHLFVDRTPVVNIDYLPNIDPNYKGNKHK